MTVKNICENYVFEILLDLVWFKFLKSQVIILTWAFLYVQATKLEVFSYQIFKWYYLELFPSNTCSHKIDAMLWKE